MQFTEKELSIYDKASLNIYVYTKELVEPLQIIWLIVTILLAVKYLLKK